MLSRCSDIVDRRYVKTNLRAEKDLSDVAEVSMPGCTIYQLEAERLLCTSFLKD